MLRKFSLSLGLVLVVALAVVGMASASVVVPTVPVSTYGDAILSGLGAQLTAIFPYAAGVTVFAIGVGMVRRWIGSKKATKI